MSFTCQFFVEGKPEPKGSMNNFHRGGKIISVDQNRNVKPWQEKIRMAARDFAPDIPSENPFILNVIFSLKKPKKPKSDYPITRPDRDKLLRAVQDALTGLIYKDDSQVIGGNTVKQYGDRQGVSVNIEEIELYDLYQFNE